MGFNPFKAAKKAVGKVFGGITKGLDKITGGKFSKIMSNKWVKGALIAVAVVTGGIAIANGVMAAGSAGVGAAAKSFAANMSMQTGKTLLSTMVEGGKQFVVGVAKGLANPLKSDAGQALTGMFDSATARIAGTPVSGADQLNVAQSGGGSNVFEQASFGGREAVPSSLTNPGVVPQAGGGISVPDYTNAFNAPTPGAAAPGWSPTATNFSLPQAAPDLGGGLLNAAAPAAESPGILSRLADGAVDYASSPMGIYQAGSVLQGWASGQALQEQWDRMDDAQKKIYRSWTDNNVQAPKLSWNPARQA